MSRVTQYGLGGIGCVCYLAGFHVAHPVAGVVWSLIGIILLLHVLTSCDIFNGPKEV